LTDKQLSVAFNHEARRRQGRLRRKGKIVGTTVRQSPQPRRLALGAAETDEGTAWETALVDETDTVLQRHLIKPEGDILAHIAAVEAGNTSDDLSQADPSPIVAMLVAESVATLALTAPVRVIANFTRWTTDAFRQALTRRCGGPPRAFGAGIEIIIVDIAPSDEIQSAGSIARELRAEMAKA
jgi:hypothetical protein